MPKPHIIAVVSGKGGVGKTMVSVALANELARGRKTLIFDLDFFNRGLTGLFASLSGRARKIAVPSFPLLADDDEDAGWDIAAIGDNLFSVCYDDLDKPEATALETTDIALLAQTLDRYIRQLADACGAEFVVLDCHGGPDNTSFAACLLAQHCLLISEPDRITLHGTLHFLRILKRAVGNGNLNIRLVFNKVIPAFSSTFIFRFYRKFLQNEFGGAPLLGMYPLEPYLTKEFEKTPFLTSVYPTSQLARKTRLVLYDLFAASAPELVSPAISGLFLPVRFCYRFFMGRVPRILDIDFIFRVSAVISLLLYGVPWLLDLAANRYQLNHWDLSSLQPKPAVFFVYLVLWLLIALAVNWGQRLDLRFTFALRTRAFWTALLSYVMLAAVWALPVGLIGGDLQDLYHGKPIPPEFKGVMLALAALLPAVIGLQAVYAWRGILDIRSDHRWLEGGLRVLFSAAGGAALGVIALYGS